MLCHSHQPPYITEQTLQVTVYSALARLAHLAHLAHLDSQSDCSLVLLSMPVLASNLLILANGRQNIDKLFIVNSHLPSCCIAKIASRWRHVFVLCLRIWRRNTAVQCCQNVDKLLQMNNDVFVVKGYEHILASSSHRLK